MSTLEAAAADDVAVEWAVTGGHALQVDALVALMTQCFSKEPRDRPLLGDVQAQLLSVVNRAEGFGSGGGFLDCDTPPTAADEQY